MPLSQIVNNIGVGKVEATFWNLTTTNLAAMGATATPFTQAMIDSFHRAATLVAALEVAHTNSGTTTLYPIIGSVLAASEDISAGGSQPARLTLLSHGFAEMQGTTGPVGAIAVPLANIGHRLGQCANGCVGLASTTWASVMGVNSRGTLIEVFDTDRCVVLF